MKLIPLRLAGTVAFAIVGIKALVIACVWLVTPPKALPLEPPNLRDVPHKWKVVVMRRHIHVGMPMGQVHQILGPPAYSTRCAIPGDIPDAPDAGDAWNGQGGSIYIYYRDSTRPYGDEIVTEVGTDLRPAALLNLDDHIQGTGPM